MRIAKWNLVAVLAALIFAAPAYACRVYRPPEQRIADGYRKGAISAVAFVTIESAEYTSPALSDSHPWSATAKIGRVIKGAYSARTVKFVRGWGSAACDDGQPLPKVGDRWVVYFWKPPERDQEAWATYPIDVASLADPSILPANSPLDSAP